MITEKKGKIVKGLGGLYEMLISEEGGEVRRLVCRAKGALRRGEEKIAVGDEVIVRIDDSLPDGVVVSSVFPRKNLLIRPPVSNLDMIFILFAAARPAPALETVDRLTAIAFHNGIAPIIVITKADLDPAAADRLAGIYRRTTMPVFVTSSAQRRGMAQLSDYLGQNLVQGRTAAFAGASGVGKSTLMNVLFPHLTLATSEISKKIERGKHTTRHVELFPCAPTPETGYLADTPGFSLLDFERFDFFGREELLPAFPELLPYVGKCRYADCAHVKESAEECAVARAAERREIAASRLASYRALYTILKAKERQF